MNPVCVMMAKPRGSCFVAKIDHLESLSLNSGWILAATVLPLVRVHEIRTSSYDVIICTRVLWVIGRPDPDDSAQFVQALWWSGSSNWRVRVRRGLVGRSARGRAQSAPGLDRNIYTNLKWAPTKPLDSLFGALLTLLNRISIRRIISIRKNG